MKVIVVTFKYHLNKEPTERTIRRSLYHAPKGYRISGISTTRSDEVVIYVHPTHYKRKP